MKFNNIKDKIIQETRNIISDQGFENFSIRKLAKQIPISPSVIYHYFPNEDDLLKQMFNATSSELGLLRSQLPKCQNTSEMLKQRINFQLDNSQMIVSIIKYYLSNRSSFPANDTGFLPEKSTLHIQEVLNFAIDSGEYQIQDPVSDAQVITHAINGFLLEYYPHKPSTSQRVKLVNKIHDFVIRALKGGDNK